MKKLAIVPIYKNCDESYIFDENARDNICEPMIELRKNFAEDGIGVFVLKNYEVEKPDALLFYNYTHTKLMSQLIKQDVMKHAVYVQLEPPLVDRMHKDKNLKRLSKIFGAVMTWRDDLIDNIKFFKIQLPMPRKAQNFEVSFSDKKLIAQISGHHPADNNPKSLYGKRIEAVRYFEQEHPEDFDMYGAGWHLAQFPLYKGKVENKGEVFKNYKFALCFENMRQIDGYVTEKIFDCMYANCVPVYWGPDNIEKYVPSDCFIDFRKFGNFDEMYEHISTMSEAEYNKILLNIGNYLNSDMFGQFSSLRYYQNIRNAFAAIAANDFDKRKAKKNLCRLKLYLFGLKIKRWLA